MSSASSGKSGTKKGKMHFVLGYYFIRSYFRLLHYIYLLQTIYSGRDQSTLPLLKRFWDPARYLETTSRPQFSDKFSVHPMFTSVSGFCFQKTRLQILFEKVI